MLEEAPEMILAAEKKSSPKTMLLTDSQRTISAIVGASVTALVVTPLDVIKTRLQSQTLSPEKCNHQPVKVWCGMMDCVCYTEPKAPSQVRINGTWDGFVKITQNEGFFKLWRGLSATLVMAIPTTVLYFIGYEHLKEYIKASSEYAPLQSYSPLVAGSIARALAVSIVSPLELFRTRLQSEPGKRGVSSKVAKDVLELVRKRGILVLWRGLSPTLWRDVPFSGIYWMGYESFKPYATRIFENYGDSRDFLVSFSSGATSGGIAAFLTTPFDVAKTWRQVGVSDAGSSPKTFQILKNIYSMEGISGLTRGISARVLKTGPSCAIMISTYELGKSYFGSQEN